jgi:hypothetical protein
VQGSETVLLPKVTQIKTESGIDLNQCFLNNRSRLLTQFLSQRAQSIEAPHECPHLKFNHLTYIQFSTEHAPRRRWIRHVKKRQGKTPPWLFVLRSTAEISSFLCSFLSLFLSFSSSCFNNTDQNCKAFLSLSGICPVRRLFSRHGGPASIWQQPKSGKGAESKVRAVSMGRKS